MKKLSLKNTFILYTVSFLILLPVIFFPFLKDGRSFVWEVDGMSQHLPVLIYYGKLLRNLVTGNGLAMVDFHIGMGFDTITTLHYYALGDPISLLSVFMTLKNAAFLYSFLILLRFYLVGISFLVFCKYWGRNGISPVLGALMYVYSGYSLFSGVRHPYFMNPLIYLPLIFLGLEQVLRRKKPYLLVIMAFISAISNFYFFYILTMLAVFYVVFRYITTYRKETDRQVIGFFVAGLRTGLYYLLGTIMAAAIFMPVVYGFLQNGRMESEPALLTGYLFYNEQYYLKSLQGVFAPGVTPGYWIHLHFSTVTAIGIVILLCKKKYWKLRVAFLLTFIALFLPVIGYFMNGFSYITNRWDFLFAFIVAYAFTVTYEDFYRLGLWERSWLIIGIIGYGAMAFLLPADKIVKWVFFILLTTVVLILYLQTTKFKLQRKLQETILTLLVFLTLGFNGYAFYSVKGYSQEFLTKEEIEIKTMNNGAVSLIQGIDDPSFYRIENFGDSARNEALYIGFHDVSAYYSLMDGNVTTFFKQLELLDQRSAYRFDNQDGRTILDTLASVKYFVTKNKKTVPYGYELKKKVKDGEDTYYLYENKFALPLGYIYTEYMLEEDYEKLNVLEKQNALLYSAVLENPTDYAAASGQDMGIGIEKLDYNVEVETDVLLDAGVIQALEPGGRINLEFGRKKNAETYVRFVDLTINQKSMINRTFKVKGEKEETKYVNIRNLYHNSYFGKNNFLVNTGYSEIGQTNAKITFPEEEIYGCDSIEVYSLNMSFYQERVQELKKSSLQNIRIMNNRIEGDVALDQNGVMILSIPYSRGWSGYVDGERVEVRRGNIMYTALQLPEGEHHIEMHYQTPILKESILISIVGLLCFIGVIMMHRYKEITLHSRRKERKGDQ